MLRKNLFKNIALIVIGSLLFAFPACEKDDEDNGDDNGGVGFEIIYGTTEDIDGNEYVTVEIGDQQWMAENLRVTRYNNGDIIPSGLNDTAWGQATEGAYAIYPHADVEGLDSEAEVVDAYGKLYNYYAVVDSRDICPAGWRVPSEYDWTQMEDFLKGLDGVSSANLGNMLKSRRQDGTPLGGEYDTKEHPRWNGHGTHYGTNDFGFSGLPGGFRNQKGDYRGIPFAGTWWSDTDVAGQGAFVRYQEYDSGRFGKGEAELATGLSVRCVKDI